MKPSPPETLRDSSALWLRWCSIVALLSSVCLFCMALVPYDHDSIPVSRLVPTLLAALGSAAFLSTYSLRRFRGAHREIDRALRETDREFSSIFQNVLDGILILDQQGHCLDANPAAASILRIPSQELIGKHFRHLFPE